MGPLLPGKRNCNDTAYKVIIDNCALPTLWEQFGKDPHMGCDGQVSTNTLSVSQDQDLEKDLREGERERECEMLT